jgi:LmbE family N-acetylglucosaminyl deacetylase
MFTDRAASILAVIAHPDDLEMMAGGAVARWIRQGHSVQVLTVTHGSWRGPDGVSVRSAEEALAEEQNAARCLGYAVENLGYATMELEFEDHLVCEVLRRIERIKPTVIVCPWERDLHHDHEVVSRIAVAASRRVPCLLMGQINFFLREVFAPNVFVDITSTWQQKIEALQCFRGEWTRQGKEWYAFLDETTRYYGRMVGVERAEGFVSPKLLI